MEVKPSMYPVYSPDHLRLAERELRESAERRRRASDRGEARGEREGSPRNPGSRD
jgi:hypothetical protein